MSSGSSGSPDDEPPASGGGSFAAGGPTLRVAVVQTARRHTLADARGRILAGIAQASSQGARVAVFCEGALSCADSLASLGAAMDAIRSAAHEHAIYVIIGVSGRDKHARPWRDWVRPGFWAEWLRGRRDVNWMVVVGPDGRDAFRYDKLYDRHDSAMPGVFHVDGVPCSAIVCADRWLRGIEEIPILQGAQVCFELSNNFPSEWEPAFEWYWQVARALRNNVWVIFANSAKLAGANDGVSHAGHGHSAVIAPDGAVVAQAAEDEELLVADLAIAQANRSTAIARAQHPALRDFWSAGEVLQRGGRIKAPSPNPLKSPLDRITIAAMPAASGGAALTAAVVAAGSKGTDLIALPIGAFEESQLDIVRDAARAGGITVVFGVRRRESAGSCNSAYVIAPDGSIMTRYDQLSAEPPCPAGTSPGAMWFSVRGIPAIVILERDALWSEIVELSAVAGARLIVLLEGQSDPGVQARQTRLQVQANLASYLTLTLAVSAGDAFVWDNLLGIEQRRAEFKRRPRPHSGETAFYSPWSANLVARTSSPSEMLVVTRSIPAARNPHYPLRTARFNPQMDGWYRLGAVLIRGRS